MIERREDILLEGGLWPFIDQRKKGDIAFCRDILEPYEKVFPRKKNENKQPTLHTGKRLSGLGSTHACVCASVCSDDSFAFAPKLSYATLWNMYIHIHIIRTGDGKQEQKGMSYKTYTQSTYRVSYFFFTLIPPLAYFSVHFSFLGSRRSLNMCFLHLLEHVQNM